MGNVSRPGRVLSCVTFYFLFAAAAVDNTCLLSHSLQPPSDDAPAEFLAECPEWVIRTTDLVWNSDDRTGVNKTLEKYFHENFTSHGSFGTQYSGIASLKEAVASTMSAFPDLEIHVSDVYCVGNDIDGYKTVMPDQLVGTNMGASAYGPATGLAVNYSGIALTYVQKNEETGEWQYVAEWVLHDELSLVSQLGFLADASVRVPNTTSRPNTDCDVNRPTWGWHEEQPSSSEVSVRSSPDPPGTLPLSKKIIKSMDDLISDHVDTFDWDAWSALMQPFWTEDMVYDTNWCDTPDVLGNSSGLREWFDHEHVPWNIAFPNATFNQLLFLGEDLTASTTTYASVFWAEDLAGITATERPATVRIFDFYLIDGEQEKIKYNWMILDLVDLMHQSLGDARVIPKPTLREGWVQGPRAMDGTPAPISEYTDPALRQPSAKIVEALLEAQFVADASEDAVCGQVSDDYIWYGPGGFGVAYGCSSFYENFLAPLYSAFPERTVNVDVFTCEGSYCAIHGVIVADQTGEWLGEAPTNQTVHLRFGFHYRIDWAAAEGAGLVADSWALFDLPSAFNDMGVNLFERFRQQQLAA